MLDSISDVEMGILFREITTTQKVSSSRKTDQLSCKNIRFLRSLGFKVIKNGNASDRKRCYVR